MLQVKRRVTMKLRNYAKKHRKKIIIIFVLIDLKRKKKKDIVFVMKAKKTYIEATPQTKAFLLHKCCFQILIEKIWKN